MPYVISEKCVGVCDQACVAVCPVDCIYGPIAGQMVIDPDECTSCGACLPVCPVDAIYQEDDPSDGHRRRAGSGKLTP